MYIVKSCSQTESNHQYFETHAEMSRWITKHQVSCKIIDTRDIGEEVSVEVGKFGNLKIYIGDSTQHLTVTELFKKYTGLY